MNEAPLEIVVVGHVDHGKSTLIGRIFHDTGSMSAAKVEAIEAMCARRGVAFEWAFLMDAMRDERDRNITIDSAHLWFRTEHRTYVLVDAPGHREFLKNMVSGAARASAALVVVAADDGVQEQTRRHMVLLGWLGIRQVAVVVNKMEQVGFSSARFEAVRLECENLLESVGIAPCAVVPVSARHGFNVVQRHTDSTSSWYQGPTLVQVLDAFVAPQGDAEKPLRLPIQDVYTWDGLGPIAAGRVESGRVRVGDELVFWPSGHALVLSAFEAWPGRAPDEAAAGVSVAFRFGPEFTVQRGMVASHVGDTSVLVTRWICARVFWMGALPLRPGAEYVLKLATQRAVARVVEVDSVWDAAEFVDVDAHRLERDHVGVVVLELAQPLVVDRHEALPHTGRFVLVEGYDVVGGGIVIETECRR